MILQRVGSWLWVATGLQFVVQLIVALGWPQPYSINRNAISDLGVTTCGMFDEDGFQLRYVCSPEHALFNASLVATGILVAAGAALNWNRWPRQGRGQVAMGLLIVGGIALGLVGLAPWDVSPAWHDQLALAQGVLHWAAMIALVSAVPGEDGAARLIRRITLGALILSVLGFGIFVLGLEGAAVPGIGWGIAERLAFDLTGVWTVVVGVLTLRAGSKIRV